MAWRCTGSTNAELVSNLQAARLIRSPQVAAAFSRVDRAHYVRPFTSGNGGAYEDSPQSIGYGATISAPHMHAHAAENVFGLIKPGARVLDVGSGSGYFCAILHELGGHVVGIDHIPQLTEQSKANLRADGYGPALDSGKIEIVCGDGRQGYAKGGPYSVIHVGAAAPTLPQALIDQMDSPGRMFIPVGPSFSQSILQVDKDAKGNVTQQELFGVRYVPLTEKDQQWV